MRDPCIMLGPDDVFHAVWTTGWYEQGIGIAHSKDLITWSDAAFLPVMVHERKAVNAWAPEIVCDDETGQYLIFWSTTIPGRFPATDESGSVNKEGVALNHRIYRTTTRDFKDYSRAELFLDPGFNVIDATIVRDGNRYLMFLKDETLRPEARKDIRLAVADHALGPYVLAPEPISKENWVEGPTAFRAGQDLFVLFDAYTRKRYEGVKSRDLKTWSGLGAELQMPAGARHGTRVRRAGEDPEGAARGVPAGRPIRYEGRKEVIMKSRSLAALAPLVLAALFVAGALSGEPAGVSAQGRTADATAPADALKSLQWRNIGPTVQAGRVSVFVGLPGDINTMYVAGAVGGIFKTTNGGVTWKAIFDDQPVASIGAIAIAPSDPNVIYAGTGEGNPRNDASIGDGIYKSIDAGDHWMNVGLPDSEKFARIVVDPRNADVVYACAMGREWGPNEERGLFKTIDGGKSWKKVLYQNDLTGCSDVDIDPTNANIVYAGMFTFRRWAWYTESGGGETAVYKSVDGGATWTRLSGPDANRGLPKGPMDRIGVAVAKSSPAIVYVISETTDEGELWRSDDAGASWQMVSRDRNINFRPFYYADIRVDPQHPNTVYALAGGLYKSEDGGRNFSRIGSATHGDHQAMWIDPTNPNRILLGDDGGFQISYDAGRTFDILNNIAFTQFYNVAYDLQVPYHLCGGLQDNGSWCGPSQTPGAPGTTRSQWQNMGGGDGFFAVPDLDDAAARLQQPPGRRDQHDRPEDGRLVGHQPVPGRHRVERPVDGAPEVPLQLERADRALAAGPEDGVLRRQRAVPIDEPRALVGRHQPGPDDERQGEAAVVGRQDRHRQHGRRVPLHDHRDRPVAGGPECHLGGHRRRQRAGDARRREDVDEHGEGHGRPGAERVDQQGGRVALRRRHGVRVGQPLAGRRLRAVLLQDGGFREDVDEDHGRAARARLVARHPRGPEGARPAVRGHRVRPLCLVERRRRLDFHPQQHPARRRARHRHPPPGQRRHRRHPRAGHLHPGRRGAAAVDRAGREDRRVPVPDQARNPVGRVGRAPSGRTSATGLRRTLRRARGSTST